MIRVLALGLTLTWWSTLACAAQEIIVDLDIHSNSPALYLVENGTITHTWPIAAPRYTPKCLFSHDVGGLVRTIEHHAVWRPTDRTRRASKYRLKEAYGPTDPGNALAGRRLAITWDHACIKDTIRIHATYDEHHVRNRARVSRGCIRMLRADWESLAKLIEIGTRVRMTINLHGDG